MGWILMTKTVILLKLNAVSYGAALSFLILFLVSCGPQGYYHGYVFDAETRKPISKVLVKENSLSGARSSYTNKNGYFKVVNQENTSSDLIFITNGYQVDTVLTRWSQHGERLEHMFTDSKSDTAFLTASP